MKALGVRDKSFWDRLGDNGDWYFLIQELRRYPHLGARMRQQLAQVLVCAHGRSKPEDLLRDDLELERAREVPGQQQRVQQVIGRISPRLRALVIAERARWEPRQEKRYRAGSLANG
jgi:hypothetical protein